ncbi:DNA polymerase I [Acetobacter sp. AN02]|uniref:DNA polymerase I n=1 Tax=Acetobacter sp. AN02 TaxID=2894186 RepID=UPI002434463D|nr:DNA polymerase I [Acetobacter sp. AN02]MDG6094658.1 DNA polymerase I [Acetobacter sp. AN02]
MTETSRPHLVLVDGSGFIFRAFHALPPMSNPEGVPVNAVFGFCNMLTRLMREHFGTHLAVIFDAGRVTFRNEIYPAYKANRSETPEDLIPQFALIREATAAFGVQGIELEGFEADDLIASYARHIAEEGALCTIVSSDKDLMQLLGGGVEMLDPIKQKSIGLAEVEARFGVTPDKVIDVQALMGDSTDNVPGVPGIGPKTASALVNEFGTLEAVLEAAPSMKASRRRDNLIEHAEAARISRELVALRTDVPLPVPVSELTVREPDKEVLGEWLDRMGFRSVRHRFGLGEGQSRPASKPPSQARIPADVHTVAAEIKNAGYGPYETITDPEVLQAWVEEARKAGVCGVDTETDGLDPLRARMVGFSLATAPGRACYVPLLHEGTLDQPVPVQISTDEALRILEPLLTDSSVLKVFQNAKFDLLVFSKAGAAPIAPVDDTMLISYAQSAGEHGQGMDELSVLHLGHTPISYDDVTGTGRNRLLFQNVPLDKASEYAAEDADVTLRLWHALRPALRVNKSLAVYEETERPLIAVLADMEQAGITVDADELRHLSQDFSVRMEIIEKEIQSLAGRSFNVASPKQLGEILFDEMNLPGGKRSKNGAWSTNESILQDLADQGHELPEKVLAWRQLAKLKNTYTDVLISQLDPATNRVHTSFQMAVTSTGRLSSNDPNLQNIPVRTEEGGRIRRAFIAAPGKLLISADYSQIELRLLATVADIPALRDAFEKGEDIHARTASEVFGIPVEGMDPLVRRRAKAINFGIIYGISAFGLGKQLGIPQREARSYIDAYFARYPQIRDYMEARKEEARRYGYVLTPFGRRCFVPGIAEKNAARRNYAERQAINAPLQGGAADIIKKAMVRLAPALERENLPVRILLQVHDELLLEVDQDAAGKTAELVKDIMEKAVTMSVPLVAETGIGANWAEAH